jgi:hypothetical protein
LTSGIGHRRENCAPDKFGYLRDYGVSEGGKALHSVGNPIIHSTNCGWGQLGCPNLLRSSTLKLSKRIKSECQASASDFVGVGNNPDTGSSVWRSQPTRRNVEPFRIIPDAGHVSEKGAKPISPLSNKQVCDVFQDDETGSKVASKSNNLSVETAAFAVDASLTPACRKVLAREPPADDIDGNSICIKSLCGKLTHVAVAGDVRPVLGEDFARERFDFAEGDGFKSACSFKAKAKPSDAREKVKDTQLFHLPRSLLARSKSGGDLRHCVLQHEGVNGFAGGHAASPVLRACATTGDSAAASSAPPVTRSASSANSGGQGLSLSCDILPFDTPMAAASWLAFIASGRLKYVKSAMPICLAYLNARAQAKSLTYRNDFCQRIA